MLIRYITQDVHFNSHFFFQSSIPPNTWLAATWQNEKIHPIIKWWDHTLRIVFPSCKNSCLSLKLFPSCRKASVQRWRNWDWFEFIWPLWKSFDNALQVKCYFPISIFWLRKIKHIHNQTHEATPIIPLIFVRNCFRICRKRLTATHFAEIRSWKATFRKNIDGKTE